MLEQSRFLAKSFSIFENQNISVHRITTSEGKILVIIVPSELSSRESVKVVKTCIIFRFIVQLCASNMVKHLLFVYLLLCYVL